MDVWVMCGTGRNKQFPPMPCSCDQDVLFLDSNTDSSTNVATAQFCARLCPKKRPQGTGVPDAHSLGDEWQPQNRQSAKKKKKGVQPDLRRVSKYPAAIAGFVPDNLPCLPEMCPSETTEGLWRSPSDTLPCDFVVSPSFSRLSLLTDTLPGKSSQLVS